MIRKFNFRSFPVDRLSPFFSWIILRRGTGTAGPTFYRGPQVRRFTVDRGSDGYTHSYILSCLFMDCSICIGRHLRGSLIPISLTQASNFLRKFHDLGYQASGTPPPGLSAMFSSPSSQSCSVRPKEALLYGNHLLTVYRRSDVLTVDRRSDGYIFKRFLCVI